MGLLVVPPALRGNTGVWILDALPVITMLGPAASIWIMAKAGRVFDTAIFSVGLVLAVVYHSCGMVEGGLMASSFLGVTGPAWRSADIYWANFLLARTLTDALGARHPITRSIANFFYPLILVACASNLSVPFAVIAPITLGVFGGIVACRLCVEGTAGMPRYVWRRDQWILWSYMAAFAVFPLPQYLGRYWFWHSVWHLLAAAGYYLLYQVLCAPDQTPGWGPRVAQSPATKKRM